MKTTFGNGANIANAKATSWRTVQRNTKSTRYMMSPMTTGENEGVHNQRDSLCLHKGYLNVHFMFGTKSTTASATFNLARSINQFIIAGRQFDENFCILLLYGDGYPIRKPQDVLNSKDAIKVYYRHRLAGNNVSGKMRIQSTSMIAQTKHATLSIKQYLVKDRVHINKAQMGPEEAVVLGWIPGSHPAFSFRDNMRETIKDQMPIEYANVEWALFPKTITIQEHLT
jgi:hypothetical protein